MKIDMHSEHDETVDVMDKNHHIKKSKVEACLQNNLLKIFKGKQNEQWKP
jgi:hypothetical protein